MKESFNIRHKDPPIVEQNTNGSNSDYSANALEPGMAQINNLKEILGQTHKKGERIILLNKLSEKLLKVAPEEVVKYASQALMMGKIVNAKQQMIKSNLILGQFYKLNEDFEQALLYLDSALQISLELEDNLSSSSCYIEVGSANWKLGRLNNAINNYHKGLELYKEFNNDEIVLSLILILGELSRTIGDLLNARTYYLEALSMQKELKTDLKEQANTLNKLGCIYLETEQYESAESSFLEAICNNKVSGNIMGISENSLNLGVVCLKLKQFDQSIQFFNDALSINISTANSLGIATALKKLGLVYYELEVYDASIRNYKEALGVFKTLGIKKEIAALVEKLGKINFQIRKYRKAISFFKQGLDLGVLLNDHRLVTNSHFYLGKISLKTRNPETAIAHFDNCIRKVELANLQSEFIDVYQEISNCYAQLNKYEEAFQMQKKFNVLLEFKLTNNDRAKVAKLKDSKSVNLKRIKQLHGQNIELKRFISSAIQELITPVRIISSFTDILMKTHDDESEQNNEEYLDIISRSSKRISSLLKDVNTFTRIIDKSNYPTTNISLESIMETVIENLAINEQTRPNVTLVLPELPKVNAERDEMTLVLESILMNSLKHNAGKEIKVIVSLEEKEDQYVVSVEDNGIGVDKEFQELVFSQFTRISTNNSYEGTGIGLTMAKKVLNNRKHDIWMETPETGVGTRVSFSVSKPLL